MQINEDMLVKEIKVRMAKRTGIQEDEFELYAANRMLESNKRTGVYDMEKLRFMEVRQKQKGGADLVNEQESNILSILALNA